MYFIGNRVIWEHVERLLARGAFAQSVLITGPVGVGSTTLARSIGAALATGSDCLTISALLPVDTTLFLAPEVVVEKGKTRKRGISIDVVRDALLFLSRPPVLGKRTVLVIDDAHTMNENTQNALLKTLEEPPPYATIIVITAFPSLLLPTVRSRLQTLSLSSCSDEELLAAGIPSAVVECAFGAPARALRMMRDADFAQKAQKEKELFDTITTKTVTERLMLAKEWSDDPAIAWDILLAWSLFLGHGTNLAKLSAAEHVSEALFTLLRPSANVRLIVEKCLLSV